MIVQLDLLLHTFNGLAGLEIAEDPSRLSRTAEIVSLIRRLLRLRLFFVTNSNIKKQSSQKRTKVEKRVFN